MKIYRGKRSGYEREVVVIVNGVSSELNPEQSQEIVNHSPDGFNWGYGGSGPAQLALGLLLDATADREIANRHYQQFKSDVVSQIDNDEWEINEVAIHRWLADRC